ncbi:hypothetical protein D3C86_1174090 [compost metagenome]
MRLDINVQASILQHGKVGDSGFRTAQQDQTAIGRNCLARPHADQFDIGFHVQGIEIIEIGNMRQDRHGNAHLRARFPFSRAGKPESILRRQLCGVGKMRQKPDGGPAGLFRNYPHAVRKQGRITAKAVDDKTFDHRRVFRFEHGFGTDEAGDDAAPVDIADEDHRRVRSSRKSHIGDVIGTQVDFGRAARPFHQHQIGLLFQELEAFQHARHQSGLHVLVIGRFGIASDLALHDHLCAGFALRLQEHRVHVHGKRHARRPRLQRLCAANLAAIGGHGRIVRHVLRLERHDRQAAPDEGTGKTGHHQRFADIRAGSLKHQHACSHVRILSPPAPSRPP